MVPVTVDPGTIRDDGDNVNEQAAACVTVNVDPEIVIVPVRLAPLVLAATL
jgi:hypothetical protein